MSKKYTITKESKEVFGVKLYQIGGEIVEGEII